MRLPKASAAPSHSFLDRETPRYEPLTGAKEGATVCENPIAPSPEFTFTPPSPRLAPTSPLSSSSDTKFLSSLSLLPNINLPSPVETSLPSNDEGLIAPSLLAFSFGASYATIHSTPPLLPWLGIAVSSSYHFFSRSRRPALLACASIHLTRTFLSSHCTPAALPVSRKLYCNPVHHG